MNRKSELHGRVSGLGRGFTLVELLVVVSIIALLIAILLPSLKKAREQAKTVVCLTHVKGLGTGVITYATEYDGKLPGPLHPAVYREQTLQSYLDRGYTPATAQSQRDRQLSWVIAQAMGQRGGDSGTKNVTDDVATCPSMEGVLSKKHFDAWAAANPSRPVFPTHYVINNYGSVSAEGTGGSLDVTPRMTNPPDYFGVSPYLGSTEPPRPPKPLSRISRASDEWMIADAWFRPRNAGNNPLVALFKQDGPYQSAWSGDALPFQPVHRSRDRVVVTTNSDQRQFLAKLQADKKKDGVTNTVFFDGHAASVQSQSVTFNGQTLMYGFPGTVNPDLRSLGAADKNRYNQLQWQ